MNAKLDIKSLTGKLSGALERFRRYSFVSFIVFVAFIYGFMMLKINTLSSAEPSDAAITEQVKAVRVPHIDEAVVRQLESLEDNSVSVQALFNEARSNPFQ